MELHLVKLLPHMTTQQSLLHPLIYISVEPFGDGLFWKSERNHIHVHSLDVPLRQLELMYLRMSAKRMVKGALLTLGLPDRAN